VCRAEQEQPEQLEQEHRVSVGVAHIFPAPELPGVPPSAGFQAEVKNGGAYSGPHPATAGPGE
jgi:hypothetical protein